MPAQTDRVKQLREQTAPGEIPYFSKSRVKKWLTCNEQFNFSYLKGMKEPENMYMRRGTAIHETFEDYYHDAELFVETNDRVPTPGEMIGLLPDSTRWADYAVPFIGNFIQFETRRAADAPTPEQWLPVAVEAEEWLDDPLDYGDEAIPWMGYADAIFQAAAFSQIPDDDGVVIVDFKTGKVPDEKYRDEGIYLEGEYYAMLFASEWDVAGVAGYYPKEDEFLISPLKAERRAKIRQAVHEMHAVNGTDPESLELNEQPLCKWGSGSDEQCAFYDQCASTWGEGLKHEEKFRQLAETGASKGEIAAAMGMDYGAVNYTFYKLKL